MTKRPDLDTIGTLLTDIQEQYTALSQAREDADPIEIELFEATVNFLAANIGVFRKTIVSGAESILPQSGEEGPVPSPEDEEVRPVEETTPEVENFVLEAPVEDTPPVVEEVENVPPVIAEAPPTLPPTTPERPLSLNEILANKRHPNTAQNPVNSRIEQIRASDLKTSISLNDKLLFIKDLFNGYSLAYSEAIELLDRYDNLTEADAFLQSNYAVKNQWAAKQETVDKLYGILQRRFG